MDSQQKSSCETPVALPALELGANFGCVVSLCESSKGDKMVTAGERDMLSSVKTSQEVGKEAKQVVPHWEKTREIKTVLLYQKLQGSVKDKVRK